MSRVLMKHKSIDFQGSTRTRQRYDQRQQRYTPISAEKILVFWRRNEYWLIARQNHYTQRSPFGTVAHYLV